MAGAYPPELMRLPAALRAAVKAQCKGDWSRVTVDARGSFTVHNQPQANGLVPGKAKKVPAKKVPPRVAPPVAPKAPAKKAPAKKAGPLPRPSTLKAPPLAGTPLVERPTADVLPMFVPSPPTAPVVFEPTVTPGKTPKKKAAKTAPPVGPLKPASVLREGHTPVERPPDDETRWVLLPGFEQTSDWDGTDLDEKAWALCEKVRQGVGDGVPLKFHDDVTALNGVDLEQVESIVRHADRVEVDPSTAYKKYPILKFHRGDTMIVVGFREPILPMIIAAYWQSHLDASGVPLVRTTTGGGGKRKTGGLPNTVPRMLTALRALGATVNEPGISDKTVEVFFDGASMGKVTCDETTKRSDIESAYQRTLRRIEAVKNRRRSGKTG